MKKFFIVIFLVILVADLKVSAQAASFVDPVQAYNKLVIEKNSGKYTLIGAFKVVGTPFFLGGEQLGDVSAVGEAANNVLVSYNTYDQSLEVKLHSTSTLLKKECKEVDSFILRVNDPTVSETEFKFINPSVIGSKEFGFLQVITNGKKYNLYKKYYSSLGIVSTNYVQAELRQFDLNYDYFYYNITTKQLKKIKPNRRAIAQEFKDLKDITSSLSVLSATANTDVILKQIFAKLNTVE